MGTGLAVVNSNLRLSPRRGGERAAEASLRAPWTRAAVLHSPPESRGRTHAGASLQGPPGHGSSPAPTHFWDLPEVTPEPGDGVPPAEATRHLSGPGSWPGPRQGPSLRALPKALPKLGGPVASHPAMPGPAAPALPRVWPSLPPCPLLGPASPGPCRSHPTPGLHLPPLWAELPRLGGPGSASASPLSCKAAYRLSRVRETLLETQAASSSSAAVPPACP